MDIINPLDTTWHLQQEDWDKLRIPLWLVKGIWDFGDVGPISNAFTELVWNPGDFQPGNKVEFLPAPWAVADRRIRCAPARSRSPSPNQPIFFTPAVQPAGHELPPGRLRPQHRRCERGRHPLPRRHRHPLRQHAGVRVHRQLLLRRAARGIGAVAGSPVRARHQQGGRAEPSAIRPTRSSQNPDDPTSPAATLLGGRPPIYPANVTAEFVFPYTQHLRADGELVRGQLHQHRLPPRDRVPARRAVPERLAE